MLLSEVLEIYLRTHVLRPVTQVTYRKKVKRFLDFMGCDKPMEAFDEDDFIQYRDHILEEGCAVTFNNYRRHLIMLFNFAEAKGLSTTNKMNTIGGAPVPRRPPKIVSTVELKIVIEKISARDGPNGRDGKFWCRPHWFWAALLKTFFYTGMRYNQLASLRWGDIDFQKQLIRLTSEGSKTHREWSIPLPFQIYQDLLEVRRRYLGITETSETDPRARVFNISLYNEQCQSKNEDSLTYWQINAFFRKLKKYTGFQVSPHRIRHTTATELMSKTKNYKLVQEQLGHTTINTTMIYVHPKMEDMKHLIDKL
jgi:integrase